MGVLDFGVFARKGAYQSLSRAFTLQVFKQSQQRAFTRIQGDVVDKVKQTGLIQRTQFGIDIATTQDNFYIGVMLLNGLRHTQSTVHRARERHRQQYHLRLMILKSFKCQRMQHLVDEGLGRSQSLGQWVKAGLAGSQRFTVAHKLKPIVHRIAQHISQVIQKKCGQVPCAVLHTQGTKGPCEGVVLCVVQNCKARTLGDKTAGRDAVRQGGVTSL